jgi:hypothetical protein
MVTKPRKPFLLRTNPEVLSAIERLASSEFRSTNVQMEVLLREALAKRGIKLKTGAASKDDTE